MAKNVKINSVIYAEVPQVSIPLAEGEGTAVFYDTSGATASSGDILNGKSAFLGNGVVTGTMSNNGAVSGSIAKADGAYTIPAGFHNGSGSVRISKEEQAKLVSGNIKSGVTVLGISGKSSVVLIGHAYFMNKTVNQLSEIMNHSIIPLLYEYFYDDRKRVASVLNNVLDGIAVEVVDDKMSRLSVRKA